MNKFISKIKETSYKYRSLIFIVLAVILFSYFRNYQSEKNFDPDKFKNISEYSEQVLEDVNENKAFTHNEVNDIDFDKRRDTDLLDTEGIKPESDIEQAIVIIMAESQKLEIASKELEKVLIEAQKNINPDDFILPINLSSLDRLNKSKKELDILQSSQTKYLKEYKKIFGKFENAILKRIDDKEYANRALMSAKKNMDITMKFHDAIKNNLDAVEEVIDFCIEAVNSGTIQYVANEDNIYFTTDELVDGYNKLIATFNDSIYAWQAAEKEAIEHQLKKNETIQKFFD